MSIPTLRTISPSSQLPALRNASSMRLVSITNPCAAGRSRSTPMQEFVKRFTTNTPPKKQSVQGFRVPFVPTGRREYVEKKRQFGVSAVVQESARELDANFRSQIYDFATMKSLSENPSESRIIIDVREPHELVKSGTIPTAINVPLKTHPDALFLTEDEFEERLGMEKPPMDKEVIFYCKSGVRSKAAAQIAHVAGYEKVGEYPGSWNEWAKNTGATSY